MTEDQIAQERLTIKNFVLANGYVTASHVRNTYLFIRANNKEDSIRLLRKTIELKLHPAIRDSTINDFNNLTGEFIVKKSGYLVLEGFSTDGGFRGRDLRLDKAREYGRTLWSIEEVLATKYLLGERL